MKRLENKTAIITGGNSGIGEAAALLFAAEGANVVITARRKEPLDMVAEKIKQAGGSVLSIPSDISNPDSFQALVQETVDKFGKINILVNNAGVLDTGLLPVDRVQDDELDRVMGINAKGTIQCIRTVLNVMLKQKSGSIVNVASIAGVNGGGGAAYVASKAAILGITRHTALRCASEGIRCNALCPGSVATPMGASAASSALDMDMLGAMAKHTDMKLPVCQPQDVANAVLFLASDESRAITGQEIVIDFGTSL